MTETYHLIIPNKEENVSLVRLSASFVAMRLNFDVEKIEDIKVCAAEACNYQINQTENFDITIEQKDEQLDLCFDLHHLKDVDQEASKFSIMIIKSLTDHCVMDDDIIRMVFKRGRDDGE